MDHLPPLGVDRAHYGREADSTRTPAGRHLNLRQTVALQSHPTACAPTWLRTIGLRLSSLHSPHSSSWKELGSPGLVSTHAAFRTAPAAHTTRDSSRASARPSSSRSTLRRDCGSTLEALRRVPRGQSWRGRVGRSDCLRIREPAGPYHMRHVTNSGSLQQRSGCKPTPTSVSASRGVDGWTLLAGGRATNPRTNLPRG